MWRHVAVDNLKACIPGKQALRRLLRKAVPYRSLPDVDELAFEQGLKIVSLLHAHNGTLGTVLEVGTGWIPTIPHILKACGVKRLILTDVEPLCDAQTFDYARTLVGARLDRIAAVSGLDHQAMQANLDRAGIDDYRCPPRTDALPDGSVDLIYSRTVLEHIAPPLLAALLAEWRRLLRPGGLCIHIVDNSDHFQHRDPALPRVSFLSRPGWLWKIACINPQNYQNRLRHSDYVTLFRRTGYELLAVEGEPDPATLAELAAMKIDRQFAGYDREDLAILTSTIVARNGAA